MITPQLNLIAEQLEGLEETIISKLIDRAQFKANRVIYESGQSGFKGNASDSLFDLRIRYQEVMDAQFGRFCVPEERPFTDNLPQPQREVTLAPGCLAIGDCNRVNITARLKKAYLAYIPDLCAAGDDGQYGSSVEHDVYALQAISRRVHYGSFYVAESKYQGNREQYQKLIDTKNADAIHQLLTRREVEEKILQRVSEKVQQIQSGVNRAIRKVIEPDVVLRFYRDCIIPCTKEGEVLYLLNRSAA